MIFTFLQFVQIIRNTRVDLEDKISSLSILDNNPQKPVVRMANLCVVSSHTVSGPFFEFEHLRPPSIVAI